jgi:hypothetical protein
MHNLADFVSAFSYYFEPVMRNRAQFTGMRFHPRIDGGIARDTAVQSEEFGSYHLVQRLKRFSSDNFIAALKARATQRQICGEASAEQHLFLGLV